MKASFPKEIWLWGLEHGHILCGVGYSIEPTTDGNGKSSVCENLTAALFRGFTPISHMDGETLQSSPSDNILRRE